MNVRKTKELIVDFRAKPDAIPDLFIDGTKVERVDEYKYLGTIVDSKLSFDANTHAIHKKCQTRLYCLQKLRSIGVNGNILGNFYRCFIQSVLIFGFLCWYAGLSVKNKNVLERIVKVCGKIVGERQMSLKDVFECHAVRKAREIEKDVEHVLSKYYELLPSGRRLRTLRFRKNKNQLSFIPQSVILLNKRMNR